MSVKGLIGGLRLEKNNVLFIVVRFLFVCFQFVSEIVPEVFGGPGEFRQVREAIRIHLHLRPDPTPWCRVMTKKQKVTSGKTGIINIRAYPGQAGGQKYGFDGF